MAARRTRYRRRYMRRYKRSFKKYAKRRYRKKRYSRRRFLRRQTKSQEYKTFVVNLPQQAFFAAQLSAQTGTVLPQEARVSVNVSYEDILAQIRDEIVNTYTQFKVVRMTNRWRLDIGANNSNYYFDRANTGSILDYYGNSFLKCQLEEVLNAPYGKLHGKASGMRSMVPKLIYKDEVYDGTNFNSMLQPANTWVSTAITQSTQWGNMYLILPGVGAVNQQDDKKYLPTWLIDTQVIVKARGCLQFADD